MNEPSSPASCPSCDLPVMPVFYFCPNCGKQLRPRAIILSTGRQIGVYLLSFFLPPLGLYPAVKYLRQPDKKTKIIGLIAIILTLLSITISFYYYLQFAMQYSQQLNSLSNPQLY